MEKIKLIKAIRIFLFILIVFGVVLLLTQKIWVPKLVNQIVLHENENIAPVVLPESNNPSNVGLSDSLPFKNTITNAKTEPTIQGTDGSICRESLKYFLIEKNTENVGSDQLIKYKTNDNQNFSCKYVVEKGDFEIKNEDAEYFYAITNNFLILDSGTAPDPRIMIIYDLNSQKKVYTDGYFSENAIVKDNIIDYWSPTTEIATIKNCPELNENSSNGLGSGIDSHVILDLSTMSKKVLGEYRCSVRQ